MRFVRVLDLSYTTPPMIMTSSQRVSGETFAIERLRTSPDLDYATLRAMAEEAGISLQPIHYGRARKQLGLPALRDSRPDPRKPAEPATSGSHDEPTEVSHDEPSEEPAPAPTPRPTMARKASVPFEFLVNELRREPNLAYGELRDRAAERGFKIAPIMYGRAKAVLGLVPVRPRGSKRAEKEAAAAPRSLKQVESVAAVRFGKQLESVRNLEQLVAVVKDLDAERRRLRAVLERIIDLIDEALEPNG